MAEPGPFRSPASAVRLSGRLLCWCLATAMASAVVDAFLHPAPGWWGAVWLLPWWLTCATALAWAALRAREKADRPPPQGGARSDWEQAA
ncbi:hypothetical protein A4E84_14880 [Streptomyces qaidamensis]|uniref:Uncharacterized protein n=1 Tax=Streptomyces qaidamensis TaxID=1783515 RepID=A0A143C0P6_9ACTN|nr:hypothetical protein [Streptomyces qaidamensis]AMW10679.1 hypothetical protein A4E84_14880 [Streptomyces qaidamensis]